VTIAYILHLRAEVLLFIPGRSFVASLLAVQRLDWSELSLRQSHSPLKRDQCHSITIVSRDIHTLVPVSAVDHSRF